MNNTLKRTVSAAVIVMLAVCMVLVSTMPAHAAKKKVYKVPYKTVLKHHNGGPSYTLTFVAKKGKIVSVKQAGDWNDVARLKYKSAKLMALTFKSDSLGYDLILKKGRIVEKQASDFTQTFKYNKKGRLIKLKTVDSPGSYTATAVTTFKYNKKGDVVKRIENGSYENDGDEEPSTYKNVYKYVCKYKKGRLVSQKVTYDENSYTKKYTYKKLKLTKAQYKKYMHIWNLFNEGQLW